MKSDVSTLVYIKTETVRMFSFGLGFRYINRVTPNLTKVSVEKMPIFCEVTYYDDHAEIFQF